MQELRAKGPPKLIFALVGTKSDLEAERQVSSEEARNFAGQEGMQLNRLNFLPHDWLIIFFNYLWIGIPIWKETSAVTGQNIINVFVEIGKALIRSSNEWNSLGLYLISSLCL